MNYKLCTPIIMSIALSASAVPALADAPGNAAAGSVLFKQRCQACHSMNAGQKPTLGPNLNGVVGRKAASSSSYLLYSPALKGSKLVWTSANIEKFLLNPSALVPGTKMSVKLPDATDRKNIASFLAASK